MPHASSLSYTLQDADIILSEQSEPYVLRVRDMDVTEKPREKLLAMGPKNLSLTELMAILLGVGTRREEVMSMAERILHEYGEKAILHETNPTRLSEALQIPLTKACQIIASFEMGRRFFAQRGGKPVVVRTAAAAYVHLRAIAELNREQLRGLYLNSRYQVIHEEVISTGSLTASIIHPREVFQPAIEYGAVAVIVAHNHPSGVLTPTAADRAVTEQLIAAGRILGIELLDHLVITAKGFKSVIGGGKTT